ncbi:MAG: hypothetical protein M3138_02815, partial [Actinomycetota bacterium]|nr:hypothetical protein [Actinomycetota bacterium]
MPDDERESDDLFEDLDKFFAPIKDVEWDEPEEAAPLPGGAPEEEHITVHSEPEPVVTVPASTDQEPEATAGTFEDDDEDGGDWYDTASLEPVDQALGGSAGDEGAVRHGDEAVDRPAEMEEPDDEQEALFPRPAADDELAAEEEQLGERPSDEELEEAASHFAESLGGEEALPPRVVQIDEENATDLMEELGAEPYPAGEGDEDVFAAMAEQEPSRTIVVGAEGLGGPSWQEPAGGGGGG